MIPSHRRPSSPWVVLTEEFAGNPVIDRPAVAALADGVSVTPDVASALAAATGTSAELWLNLQAAVDAYTGSP